MINYTNVVVPLSPNYLKGKEFILKNAFNDLNITIGFTKNYIYGYNDIDKYFSSYKITDDKIFIKDIKYVEASSGIINEEADPHFWLSPIKAKKQMENIKNAFMEADPTNADYYNSNYNIYAIRLDELDNTFRNYLSNVKNTNLVVTHPAFGHFCKEYSLNQVAIARDEADPKSMSETISFIKNNNIKAIFYEDFSSSRLVDSIAKESGAKIYTLNPIESLSEEYINAGEDYFSVMEKNFLSLTNGLN